jgi:hypothetical protein
MILYLRPEVLLMRTLMRTRERRRHELLRGAMGFQLEDYQKLRPYLYHISPTRNIGRILAMGRLECTADLLQRAGRMDLLRMRRDTDVALECDGQLVLIRDHAPLNPINIAFEAGWTLGDLVEYVNRRVFFWPGTATGPVDYGIAHFARYADERPVVLRVRLGSLLAANPGLLPQFSRYNTGAARQNRGRPISRGPSTFTAAGRFHGTPGQVKEVAFVGAVELPTDSDRAFALTGSWRRAFERAAGLA